MQSCFCIFDFVRFLILLLLLFYSSLPFPSQNQAKIKAKNYRFSKGWEQKLLKVLKAPKLPSLQNLTRNQSQKWKTFC